jgi:hypothetical protein
MRKLLLIAMLTSFISVAYAQENMMSKRGTPILPEAGDWSIGIDAVPFIDWAFDKTRIFSNTGVTSSGGAVTSQVPMTLVGLYMKDANTAYRARLGLNFNSHSTDYTIHVNNDSSDAGSHEATDNIKTSHMGIMLGAGIQKSRGKGRLHGIYGAEAMIGFDGGTKTTYDYGNAFILDSATAAHGGDLTYNAGIGQANIYSATAPGNTTAANTRTTESKTGSGISFGVDAFVGVEYFVAPKMSVSAEYNWGIMLSTHGEGETTSEYTVANTSTSTVYPYSVKTNTSKSGKSSDFNVGNGDINTSSTGSIVFHFYF